MEAHKRRAWKRYTLLVLLLVMTLLGASPNPPKFEGVVIKGVPHVKQKPDYCGEACVEMYLKRLGHPGDQDWVFSKSGLSGSANRGVYTRELKVALDAIGFITGPVWYRVQTKKAPAQLERLWAELHADLLRGVPSIICMRYDEQPDTTEHFRLILGYDARTDEVIFHEPAESNGAYRRMRRALLLKLWPLKYRADTWTVIRARLEAGPKLKPRRDEPPLLKVW